MSEAFLSLSEVSKRYPNGTLAVDRVSLDVREGELLSFLGPSGCGKTTILRLIAGFETLTAGEIRLAGKRLDLLPPNRRGATMVFQGYALFPHLSVFENVAYGPRVRGVGGPALAGRVERALDLVGLRGLERRQPSQLSGGQQQRVALARALILEPSLLLFDEPLSNLDAKLREQMRLEIRTLQQRVGITAVYVTHDQAEAMTLSDRIAVVNAGRIEQVGPPRQVYESPATRFVADFIGRATFLASRALASADGAVEVELFGQRVRIPTDAAFAPGDAAEVLVRPEAVALDAEAGADAVVAQATFVGGLAQYILRVGAEPGPGHAAAGARGDAARRRRSPARRAARGDAARLRQRRSLVRRPKSAELSVPGAEPRACADPYPVSAFSACEPGRAGGRE